MYDLLGTVLTNTIFSSINLMSVYASVKFQQCCGILQNLQHLENPANFQLPRAFWGHCCGSNDFLRLELLPPCCHWRPAN
jgi:hypothetical protein